MNVIIDGIEYKPVEQKVDQEREDAIEDMEDAYYTGYCEGNRFGNLYDKGYRKAGEAVLFEVAYLYYMEDGVSKSDVDARYTITKKAVK